MSAGRAFRLTLALLVVPNAALAQAPRPAPAPVPARPAAPPATAAPPADAPIEPTVDDPMLAPVPPAKNQVSGWKEALQLINARSTDLRVALGDLERARAATRIQWANAVPTLGAGAQINDSLLRTAGNPLQGFTQVQFLPAHPISYQASLQLTIPVFQLQQWHEIHTAKENEKASELAIAEQKRVLAAAVADALVAVVTAERIADLNRSGLRAALERLALTKRRAELGAATALDVVRTEQDAATARATVVTGDESLRQAREALGQALGYPEAWGVPSDLNLDDFARASEQACPRAANVEARTDVATARQRIEVARSGLRDWELSFFPTVNIVSQYGFNNSPFVVTGKNPQTGDVETAYFGYTTSQSWYVAGVLSWTIFDGGIRYGQLRDYRAQIDQNEAKTEGLRRQAQIQVIQTTRGVEVAEEARKVAVRVRDLAKDADRLTRLNFQLGRGTSLELVDAGRTLREAEIQLALREFDTVQARIRALLAISTCNY